MRVIHSSLTWRAALLVTLTAAALVARLACAQDTPSAAGRTADSATTTDDVAEESAGPRVTVAPDMVRLTDGAEYYGILSEKVPGSHVALVTAAGHEQRFDWSTVVYAGRASDDALRPTAASATEAEPSVSEPRLTLQANHPGLLWMAANDESSRSRVLCASPCTTQLEPGRYRLGLSRDGKPVWQSKKLHLEGDERLVGLYHSERGSRILGGILLPIGLAAATWMIAAGSQLRSCTEREERSMGVYRAWEDCERSDDGKVLMGFGIAVGFGAILGAVRLLTRKDSVNVVEADSLTRN